MRTRLISLGFSLVAALIACGPKPAPEAAAPPAVDAAAVLAGVADLWARWSAADTAGDVAAIADMVTDSVRLDIKGLPPILGRAGYVATATEMYKMFKYDPFTITPEMTSSITNELAYELGTFNQVATDLQTRKKNREYTRYAAALRKGADGKWRLAYWIAFADSTVAVK